MNDVRKLLVGTVALLALAILGTSVGISSSYGQCNVQQQQTSASSAAALQNLAVLNQLQQQATAVPQNSAAAASAVAGVPSASPSVAQLRALAAPIYTYQAIQPQVATSASGSASAAASAVPSVPAPILVAPASNNVSASAASSGGGGGGGHRRLLPFLGRTQTTRSVAITRVTSR